MRLFIITLNTAAILFASFRLGQYDARNASADTISELRLQAAYSEAQPSFEDCLTVDVTANLTAKQYLQYMGREWLCEDEKNDCTPNDFLDSMLRDICGVNWATALNEWERWQREAQMCQCDLDSALHRQITRPQDCNYRLF